MNTRLAVWCVPVVLVALAACRRPPQPGDPLRGLGAAERARFDSGRVAFDRFRTLTTEERAAVVAFLQTL